MSGSRIRKMKYVKQRFNSTAVPLQRSILFFEAIWSWCIDVIATRPGQEPAKHAARFLSAVTAEDLLQAAMMADASDEHLMLRRFFDTRGWDPMSVGSELDLFLRNLDFLFIKQHAGQPPQEVGCMRSGFVRHACEVLSKPHVCWVNGTQRVVGGPGTVTTPLLEKCLSRMANWVRLTITAVSAEFPRWQLLRALDVFHLAKHTKSKAAAPAASDTDLQRLATAFGVDDKLLKMEFESCLHIAQNVYMRAGAGDNVSAWATACNMLHRGSTTRLKASPLTRVLQIAACWRGLSTSSIEQSFGKIKTGTTADTRHCSEATESIEARVCCDLRGASDEFKARVFAEASIIWGECWPRQRASGKQRVGNFSAKRPLGEATEQGFLCKRRRLVNAAAASASSSSRTVEDIYNHAVAAGSSTWSDPLENKEINLHARHQATKYSGEHWMLPQDRVGEKEKRLASAARAKNHAKAERAQDLQKSKKSVFKRKVLPLAGMTVYVCERLDHTTKDECMKIVKARKMHHRSDPLDAVYFVCSSPAAPTGRVKLVAGMLGGMLVTPSWLKSGGQVGLAMSAESAVQSAQRRIWISDSFAALRPEEAAVVRHSIHCPASRWRACTKDIVVILSLMCQSNIDC